MTREQWTAYAIIRKNYGKKTAKKYYGKFRSARTKTHDTDIWTTVFSDYDSITKKFFYPFFFPDNGWEQYVDREWRYVNSPYDCSGQWFTRSIDRYTTTKGTWVYHTMSLDV